MSDSSLTVKLLWYGQVLWVLTLNLFAAEVERWCSGDYAKGPAEISGSAHIPPAPPPGLYPRSPLSESGAHSPELQTGPTCTGKES